MQLARNPPCTMRLKCIVPSAVTPTASTSEEAVHAFQLERDRKKASQATPKDPLQVETTCNVEKLSDQVVEEIQSKI